MAMAEKSEPSPLEELIATREPSDGVFEEAFTSDGALRSDWAPLLQWLADAPKDAEAAALETARLRAESGIAFSTSRTPEAGQIGEIRDPLPVLLSVADWAEVERGLIQRARLLEATLSDLYGPAETIAEGIFPPGLAYGQRSFAAHCAKRGAHRWLYVYEADVARSADGRWMVLADRVDTPLGDGWLLANRIATSQALSEPFLSLGVRRLATHYGRFQQEIESHAGQAGRVALMTLGEKDPRFFSHAYFARYLDATLVEPADLTVRAGACFMKTLGGLKKIDVLLRGAPDRKLDALHRPRDAAYGAPALSAATPGDDMVVGNAIGAASLAYRGMAPYAPMMCQSLLGEDLTLSDAPCLWLGDPAARAQVLEEPEFWFIAPVNGRREGLAIPVSVDPDRDALKTHLERHGERFVAVATPPLAHTPVWRRGRLAGAEWMMRVFVCATPDGWSVAPGGVASMVAPGSLPPPLGFGKDVWVLPERDAEEPAPSIATQRIADAHMRRTGRELLSRVADDLFWLGRNAERAETTLRILDLCARRRLAGNRADARPEVLSRITEIHASKADALTGEARFLDAARRLVDDPDEAWGLNATLVALRRGLARARAHVSEESWRYLDQLCADRRWYGAGDMRRIGDMARLIEESLRALAAFAGSSHENLTRNFAWRFLEMGRRIERGVNIARAAEALIGEQRENEETYLRAWLTLSDSRSAYRSRYMTTPQPAAVLDLLFLDEANPRSLAYQLAQLEQVLAQLPYSGPYRSPEHRLALSLLTEIRLTDAGALTATAGDAQGEEARQCAMDPRESRPDLLKLSERCQLDLSEISNLVSRAYFAHAEAPLALTSAARQNWNERAEP